MKFYGPKHHLFHLLYLWTMDSDTYYFIIFDIISLYSMDMFHGEPIIQELLAKIKFVREELEKFEDVYSLTTDIEAIEEDLGNDDRTDDRTAENKEEAT